MNTLQGAHTRARQRARTDHIRAYVRNPGKLYHVWSRGRKYVVWYNYHVNEWHCTCPATTVCKHLVRVKDREERRIRQEALDHVS